MFYFLLQWVVIAAGTKVMVIHMPTVKSVAVVMVSAVKNNLRQ